ncbi:MAG TPA: hypothetical protein VMD77_08735 [Candidatus Baltobacteraceae bacterium]|nr:hypothetical protein [Candidatus Baltobacteraceae bacterium]
MFSGKNEPGWDALRASFNDAILNGVNSKLFYSHMQAMTIEIVSIAITKTSPPDTGIASRLFVSDFLESNHHQDVALLASKYNSAFGSSFTDGVRPMVDFFSKDVASSLLAAETVDGFYGTLYGLLRQMCDMFKQIKFVS